jgi:hypothetical protein
MSRNVQKYSREIYARASEALHCRVHATLMLPLFMEQSRRTPVGVLEVVQVRLKSLSCSPLLNHCFRYFWCLGPCCLPWCMLC